MADKMRLYAGDEDIDAEELERALTIVRRKMTDPESHPDFLRNPEVTFVLHVLRGAEAGVPCDESLTHPIARFLSRARNSVPDCFASATNTGMKRHRWSCTG